LPRIGSVSKMAGSSAVDADNTGVGVGPGMTLVPLSRRVFGLLSAYISIGPIRHPRPLTAADLHMQLEKEQEAVVCS